MARSKRLLYILLTILLVLVVGYFIFTATQLDPVELDAVTETVGAVE